MKSALVLVDLQEDFLAEPGLEPHRDTVIAGAASLLASARAHGAPVVHIHTRVDRASDARMPHWKAIGRWSCESGTPGSEPPQAIAPRDGETILYKSAFGVGQDALRAAIPSDCDHAVVAGVHSHGCVREAVLDLHALGLDVNVAADAIGSQEPQHAAQTEAWLRARLIRWIGNDTADILFAGAAPADHADQLNARRLVARTVAAVSAPRAALSERLAILGAAAALAETRSAELAETIVAEVGKPIRFARGEAARTAALFRAVAARVAAEPLEVREVEGLVRYRPLGTVAVITPWNNPVAIAAGQLAPAFAFGNAILWKPPPAGAACARVLHQLLIDAGVEPAALQLLPGGADVGIELVRSSAVDAVCFTGATATGRVLAALCGDLNLPLQAELGGNNAAIVTAAADLPDAARRIAEAAFGCAGQRCTATRRAIIFDAVHDEIVGLLEQATVSLAWGDPRDAATEIGPLINESHAARIAAIVDRARSAGHIVLQPHSTTGTVRPLPFYPPTLVICDDPDAEIVQEESFGPILVVQRARDLEHALALQNGVRHGLAAAIFTSRPDEQQAFLDTARAGILKLNQATVEAGVDIPFLGWKTSGIGPPQHGAANREFFTRAQAVYGVSASRE